MPKKFPTPQPNEHPKGGDSPPKTAAELRADQWAAFRTALEAGDDSAIAQGEVALNLDPRQVEMCRLALTELTKLETFVEENKAAAREAEATGLALSKVRGMVPVDVDQAEDLARREIELLTRHSEAARLAGHVRVAEISIDGIKHRFSKLLGEWPEERRGALPATLANAANERGLHRHDPLAPDQPAEKRRRILVAKSDRHLASKPTA